MSSYSTKYRKEHPEYYEKERVIDRERVKNIYKNNPEYREKVKQQALARYYKIKEQKMNPSIAVGMSSNPWLRVPAFFTKKDPQPK